MNAFDVMGEAAVAATHYLAELEAEGMTFSPTDKLVVRTAFKAGYLAGRVERSDTLDAATCETLAAIAADKA